MTKLGHQVWITSTKPGALAGLPQPTNAELVDPANKYEDKLSTITFREPLTSALLFTRDESTNLSKKTQTVQIRHLCIAMISIQTASRPNVKIKKNKAAVMNKLSAPHHSN